MDVSESPEQSLRSPAEKEEEDGDEQRLSDDDILKESGSEQDGEEELGTTLGDEEDDAVARALSHGEEEENHSDPEDPLSESKELKGSLRVKEDEEDRANDLGDEASSVTRELDEHELDYDEEVPEDCSPGSSEGPKLSSPRLEQQSPRKRFLTALDGTQSEPVPNML
uniref:Uncharacterized protein n=1 Tax=Salvator merianae TaxID=96440 RepID=A0A8D0BQG7_SALMN